MVGSLKKLPNGAIILLQHRKSNGEWVYLCFWEGHHQQYVTWLAPAHDKNATRAGNYFEKFKPCLNDFDKRCTE